MLSRLIDWSVRHRTVVLLSTLFITLAGLLALWRTPVDALPDLSDVQVVVVTDAPGQAPQVVEDQVTTPLTNALLSVPGSRVVRGFSYFGVSFVYVIFDEGTDTYWARSRVLESLGSAAGALPSGMVPRIGPDASGAGWVYQYVLTSAQHSLAQLRALQDWLMRPQLSRVEGVAEVAPVGGFVQQYQVVVDPLRMRAYGLNPATVADAIRQANIDGGGRAIEVAETEIMVRVKGYLSGREDLERIVLKTRTGTPVLLRDIARIELGPDERRGLAEFNGEGETVSGIVVARHGHNALSVIEGVRQKLAEVQAALPEGVSVQTVYDRSHLIHRAVATLRNTLLEEAAIVALVCAVFLMHLRSSLVVILMLPVGMLVAFIGMRLLNIPSNIMSLGGVAIAVGTMVDAAIVMVENAHRHLERLPPGSDRRERHAAIATACKEVGPALFTSLLIITVSFVPVFALQAQEGRLFAPLAWTKTWIMAGSAVLSVTLVPVLMLIFMRGPMVREQANPVQRALVRVYRPLIERVLKHRVPVVAAAVVLGVLTLWPASRLGSEFMPTLNEGTLFYMPTGQPAMSVTTAAELLQKQDRIIRSFPEVQAVLGKAGRALTATDPAPLEMFETLIELRPEHEWRSGMTLERLVSQLDQALQFPGVSNAWTMPIKARTDMLSTGIRSALGVKVFGKDLGQIEQTARAVEAELRKIPGTSSAYAERVTAGWYLDIEPDRLNMARHGVRMEELRAVLASAVGGEVLTTLIEGRQRFGVSLRYPRALRDEPDKILSNVLVPVASEGAPALVPLGEMARVQIRQGATSIRTENNLLVGYVYVDVQGRDLGSYVRQAKQAVAQHVALPEGAFLAWSGQYEYMERASERLQLVVPLTLMLIVLLLYFHFRNWTQTLIVLLSLPFALLGGVWFMWAAGYPMSVASAVGFVALAGVAAETGIVMLIYLDQAWRARQGVSLQAGPTELQAAIMEGAVGRVRPKMMTVVAVIAGLLPILWSSGTGAEVMRRIAAPMVGGMLSSAVLTLVVIPAVYSLTIGFRLSRTARTNE
jgi:Cu(I)/Ag(I) efflux system membrane protein CusA/SilA